MRCLVYLDHAATSFPKPHRVIAEIGRCMRHDGGNPGRGTHALAMAAAERIYLCRREIGAFFGFSHPERVIFTMNTTMAINTLIKGVLRWGDHVLISDMEHNSVLRPLYKLAREGRITFDVFPTMVGEARQNPAAVCAAIEARIRPNTRMLICAHASNICSAVLPLREIGALCHRHGILFAVDAAQSAGHLPIHVEDMGIDALCVPGHKGLLGPQGIGFLLLGEGIEADTLVEGGSGLHSLDGEMPDELPERFEAGTLPTPAISGLLEGIREVKRRGLEQISARESGLIRRLQRELSGMEGITLYAPHHQGSILLFNLDGIPADRVGQELNRLGFCARAGYHCSALGHRTLQTPAGGAVRVSVGASNTAAQIDAFAEALYRCRSLAERSR
ncbi:MAG: aminotransferase class V-fold PLP-dependent enzyme [Clostridia bacterium]|nr:aminotransferase class V-fold PLP-dependent enzyme [Clostridia bacterium]